MLHILHLQHHFQFQPFSEKKRKSAFTYTQSFYLSSLSDECFRFLWPFKSYPIIMIEQMGDNPIIKSIRG